MAPVSKSDRSPFTLTLRVTVQDPPPGISWALQLGRGDLAPPSSRTETCLCFDFAVEVVDEGAPGKFRLRGPAVQGRPGERFVYLNSGLYAGQTGAAAGWRAKVSLEGIHQKLLDAVREAHSGRLEAQIAGTARDGGPARATTPLLGEGWRVA